MKKGFTLIEMLVVVLIIGVLSAVALPQYQKAVEKSKATQAITMLNAAYKAAASYYAEIDDYPDTFEDMGFEVPWTGKTKWDTQGGAKDTRSNGDWSLQIYQANQGHFNLYAGRISGKYKGSGFEVQVVVDDEITGGKIRCAEKISGGLTFAGEAGDYCKKIMGGTLTSDSRVQTYRVYNLP